MKTEPSSSSLGNWGKEIPSAALEGELTDFEDPSVVLLDTLVVCNSTGAIESDDRNGEWILRVDKSSSHFRLISSEGLGLYFEKDRRQPTHD